MPVKDPSRQLVIAHYEKPLAWAESIPFPALCYSKGPETQTTIPQVRLPNVGLDGYCYLRHIIDRWEDLADFTLFCHDCPHEHWPNGLTAQQFLADAQLDYSGGPALRYCREWDKDGRLVHWGPYLERFQSGAMKSAKRTMVEWFQRFFDVDLWRAGQLLYTVGANFVASRRCLQRVGKDIYKRMLDEVSGHREPEEAYYLERAWVVMLGR
jgi:hypothetical protein